MVKKKRSVTKKKQAAPKPHKAFKTQKPFKKAVRRFAKRKEQRSTAKPAPTTSKRGKRLTPVNRRRKAEIPFERECPFCGGWFTCRVGKCRKPSATIMADEHMVRGHEQYIEACPSCREQAGQPTHRVPSLLQLRCSRQGCEKILPATPYTIRDHAGQYCSRECREQVSGVRRKKAHAPVGERPVVVGREEQAERRQRTALEDKAVIRLLSKKNPYHGERAAKFALIKDRMTVEQYRAASEKAGFGRGVRPLVRAMERTLISIEE